MSVSLLLPAGLFALFALALPLLLHLQRRRQTPPPRLFAALAYIDPQALPRKRVRIEDWPLLLLRLLLLAAIALLLAQPLLHGRDGPHWVLLWPGLDPARAGAVPEGAELRWLAPGFPEVPAQAAAPLHDAEAAPLSLLRQLAFERPLAQKLSLRVPARVEGIEGALPALGRTLDWQVVDSEVEAREAAPASPLQVAVLGDAPNTFVALKNYFAEDAEPQLLITEAQPERGAEVLLQFGEQPLPAAWQRWLEDGGRVLRITGSARPDSTSHDSTSQDPTRAATSSADAGAADAVDPDAAAQGDEGVDPTGPSQSRHAGGSRPASAEASPELWRGQRVRVLGERVGAGELRTLDCALAPECLPELYEGGFPELFASWLAPVPTPPDAAFAQALAPIEGGPAPQPAGEPLRAPLLVLILLLLVLERWLAAARLRP